MEANGALHIAQSLLVSASLSYDNSLNTGGIGDVTFSMLFDDDFHADSESHFRLGNSRPSCRRVRTPAGLCGLVVFEALAAEDTLRLTLQRNGERIELRWPAAVSDANRVVQRPLYELQQSTDLVHWQSTGQAYRGKAGETELSAAMPRTATPVYYRLAGRASGVAAVSSGHRDGGGGRAEYP